ncbi:MAG TPA: translation initiation factor IF-3, partial [Spirochaetota bacterium]|nr:translation initiation factor IF-3 [Spirochaetota bacterium]
QKIIKIKEIKFRPITDEHDFEYKVKNGVKFLERGDKVKFTVRFRGREMAHEDLGFRVIDKVREIVQQNIAVIEEKKAAFEGRNLIMIMAPVKKTAKRPASGDTDDDEEEDVIEVIEEDTESESDDEDED